MIARIALLFLMGVTTAMAQTLEAPATAKAGGQITVTVTGKTTPRDFVTIVPKGAKDGTYAGYEYTAKPGALKLTVPPAGGDYEIRLLGAASPYPTLAKRPLIVEAVTATIDAPAQVAAGAKFEVKWTGPKQRRGTTSRSATTKPQVPQLQVHARRQPAQTQRARSGAGATKSRYFLGTGDTVIARKNSSWARCSASVSAPATVGAGGKFTVTWKGPNNPRDFITIVKAGSRGEALRGVRIHLERQPAAVTRAGAAGRLRGALSHGAELRNARHGEDHAHRHERRSERARGGRRRQQFP